MYEGRRPPSGSVSTCLGVMPPCSCDFSDGFEKIVGCSTGSRAPSDLENVARREMSVVELPKDTGRAGPAGDPRVVEQSRRVGETFPRPKIRVPRSLPPELREAIKEHNDELLKMMTVARKVFPASTIEIPNHYRSSAHPPRAVPKRAAAANRHCDGHIHRCARLSRTLPRRSL